MAEERLRYVVLRHEGVPEPHFDLMFEMKPGAALTTWRSLVWPLQDKTPLTLLDEHRRYYLTYEGPVSGGRGVVRRVTAGAFELVYCDYRSRGTFWIRFADLKPMDWLFAYGQGEWAAFVYRATSRA